MKTNQPEMALNCIRRAYMNDNGIQFGSVEDRTQAALEWAATKTDRELLALRNLGKKGLAVIRGMTGGFTLTEPRTKAGRAIMAGWDRDTEGDTHEVTRDFVLGVICAVEQELLGGPR